MVNNKTFKYKYNVYRLRNQVWKRKCWETLVKTDFPFYSFFLLQEAIHEIAIVILLEWHILSSVWWRYNFIPFNVIPWRHNTQDQEFLQHFANQLFVIFAYVYERDKQAWRRYVWSCLFTFTLCLFFLSGTWAL